MSIRRRPLRHYPLENLSQLEGGREHVEKGRDVLREHEDNIRELDQQIDIIMKKNSAEKQRQASRKNQAGKENREGGSEAESAKVESRGRREEVSMGRISRNKSKRVEKEDDIPTARVHSILGERPESKYLAYKLSHQQNKSIEDRRKARIAV